MEVHAPLRKEVLAPLCPCLVPSQGGAAVLHVLQQGLEGASGHDLQGAEEAIGHASAVREVDAVGGHLAPRQRRAEPGGQEDRVGVRLHGPVVPGPPATLPDLHPDVLEGRRIEPLPVRGPPHRVGSRDLDSAEPHGRSRAQPCGHVAKHHPVLAAENARAQSKLSPHQRQLPVLLLHPLGKGNDHEAEKPRARVPHARLCLPEAGRPCAAPGVAGGRAARQAACKRCVLLVTSEARDRTATGRCAVLTRLSARQQSPCHFHVLPPHLNRRDPQRAPQVQVPRDRDRAAQQERPRQKGGCRVRPRARGGRGSH
mmetsp:Transcript_56412/g.175419  ORF Transcript_56412/g.175419 Transcript_56412/m.175419 type:complete len:313 (-) Transcript_56412:234-1172(-)